MIKSLFVSAYITYLLVGFVISIYGFNANHSAVAWWASILGHGFPILWFTYIYIRRLVNHQFVSLLVTISSGVCALIAVAQYYVMGDVTLSPVILAWISFFGWLIYHFWYTRIPVKHNIKEGDRLDLPELVSGRLNPNGYTLMVFHRGNWCPFCLDQLKEYSTSDLLEERSDVRILSISNQSNDRSSKFNFGGQIEFVDDPDFQIGEKLNIKGMTYVPLGLQTFGFRTKHYPPISILLDSNSKVIAIQSSTDYRERPKLQYFVRYIEAL
ncbi:MAG: redoxin domain-containing protein [Flavobacteriales bacterium]|nr:redoxin domain-containing protein [Flavobacteriales bacterium]